MQRNNLKVESYPFDWIFSNLEIIEHCMDNDFKIFLDKSYYKVPTGLQEEKKCIHTYYKQEPIFNHHNPLNKEDYDYYIRCVDRFRKLLRSPAKKLFIMMNVNGDCTNIDVSKKLNQNLSRHTSNYDILYINHILRDADCSHTITKEGNITYIDFKTKYKSSGTQFLAEEANIYVDNLIKSLYKFDLTSSNKPHAVPVPVRPHAVPVPNKSHTRVSLLDRFIKR